MSSDDIWWKLVCFIERMLYYSFWNVLSATALLFLNWTGSGPSFIEK